ncbi:hypothetical protein [Mucilaginibacter aquatilis]|uniref:Uncharacterized protein n=1 Tax=Mucilaginibacter aquatilis TaxID=1517760 RepID=A0A6I4I6D3_9SPHI|nr:hypothetical protein [Mucilaginibacter aquatilis]MVN90632.1 hypothetical protein [Mucilaginibacter aquatilis]
MVLKTIAAKAKSSIARNAMASVKVAFAVMLLLSIQACWPVHLKVQLIHLQALQSKYLVIHPSISLWATFLCGYRPK